MGERNRPHEIEQARALAKFEQKLNLASGHRPGNMRAEYIAKRQDKYEYLIRTTPDNKAAPIGPRSPETERLNKAVRVGRAPNLVVDILRALEDRGLDRHFIVVGNGYQER